MKKQTKILMLLNLMIASSSLMASEANSNESCVPKKIQIIGRYGKFSSPVLETYSEASGNLTELFVQSKVNVAKLQFVWKNEKNDILKIENLPLKKNHTANFDLIKKITDFKIRPKHLLIAVENPTDDILCAVDVALIEKDGQDGVLKRP